MVGLSPWTKLYQRFESGAAALNDIQTHFRVLGKGRTPFLAE